MNSYSNGSDAPIKYTIRINAIGDLPGFIVEVSDSLYYKNYTLSGIYYERVIAIRDADTFIDNLNEQENSMFIN